MALIIVAHPDLGRSFANSTIIDELKKTPIAAEIRNLHELYPDFRIDVNAEQQALLRHDAIVFQYPFYWYGMPAILKHWFDEVFTYQFAYGAKGDKLKGKHFIPSFTVGSSERSYTALGFQHFRVHEFCKNLEQTAYHSQMNYVDPIYFHGTSTAAGYKEQEIRNNAKLHARKLIDKVLALQIEQNLSLHQHTAG